MFNDDWNCMGMRGERVSDSEGWFSVFEFGWALLSAALSSWSHVCVYA